MTLKQRSLLALAVAACTGATQLAVAQDEMRPREGRRWWQGEVQRDFWDSPCEVKTESKRGEYKREIKCKDGVGATWRSDWKQEYRDGPCLVKQEAKRDEFKEEIKCRGRD